MDTVGVLHLHGLLHDAGNEPISRVGKHGLRAVAKNPRQVLATVLHLAQNAVSTYCCFDFFADFNIPLQ